jgi:hypothetical protein
LIGVTVALRGIDCGLPVALLGMLTVADSDPAFSAKSTTRIGQLLPGASEEPHKLIAVKSALAVPAPGVTDARASDIDPVPEFVRVTVL